VRHLLVEPPQAVGRHDGPHKEEEKDDGHKGDTPIPAVDFGLEELGVGKVAVIHHIKDVKGDVHGLAALAVAAHAAIFGHGVTIKIKKYFF
jgi:hypothetical protein